MAQRPSKPITFLQKCQAFLDEVSKGERRTTLTHRELMIIATYLRREDPGFERSRDHGEAWPLRNWFP